MTPKFSLKVFIIKFALLHMPLEFLNSPKYPAKNEFYIDLGALSASGQNVSSLVASLANSVCSSDGYLMVDFMLSLIPTYDIQRILLALKQLKESGKTTDEDLKSYGITHEVISLAMVMSIAEGAFFEINQHPTATVCLFMVTFLTLELIYRKEHNIPNLPILTFGSSVNEINQLFEEYINK
jgi:hypothetical protein